MKKFISFATVAVLGFGLAGCGGSSEQNFIDQADEFDALANRIDSMALSGPRVVDNTAGRASFSGKASIGAGSSSNATVLVGDADININFTGNTTIDGEIDNVVGSAGVFGYVDGFGNFQVIDAGSLDNYSGVISLSNGSVGSGNQLDVDYAGTLRGNGDTLVMSGTMDGYFLGNPQIRALEAYDTSYGSLNGSSTLVGIGVIAERD